MSATRLLVLGAIRILQPVHGYDVRRELISWRLEAHTNVKPGSIYSAIRTLEKDGLIAVAAQESEDRRPERTTYTITTEGEKEFQILLRQAWWTVSEPAEPLIPALALMPFMNRDELISALHARIGQLEGAIDSMGFLRTSIKDGATGAEGEIPEHVREIVDFITGRTRAELEWSRTMQKRLRAGDYILGIEHASPGSPSEADDSVSDESD